MLSSASCSIASSDSFNKKRKFCCFFVTSTKHTVVTLVVLLVFGGPFENRKWTTNWTSIVPL